MKRPARVPRLSWIRFFPEDFLGGVQQMDCRQVGQYMLMLCAQWCAERSAERSGVRTTPAALKSVLRGEDLDPDVAVKFESVTISGRDFLRNQRMSNEIAESLKEYGDRAKGADQALSATPSDTLSATPSVPKPQPQPQPQRTTRTENEVSALTRGDTPPAQATIPGTPTDAVKATPPPWTREACDDWISRYQGTAPGGRIGRALKPLVGRHGWGAVRVAWQGYLAQTEGDYASAERFAATYGQWSGVAAVPVTAKARARDESVKAFMRGASRAAERHEREQAAVGGGDGEAPLGLLPGREPRGE